MRYVPRTTVATKERYDIYSNGKKISSTFDKRVAGGEYQMGRDIKTVLVAK